MNYHTHILNSENHSHILGRQDAVTGDTIKANDEVVFCSACQSVFLKDSWEYMNEEYCGQRETLGFVPAQEKEIKAGKKDKLLLEVSADMKTYRLSIIVIYFTLIICIPSIFGFLYIFIEPQSSFTDKVFFSISALILSFLLIIASRNAVKNAKKNYYIGTTPLQVYQDKIISFNKVYQWKNVETIIHTSYSIFSKIPDKLEIKLVDETIKINLSSKYPYNTEFLIKIMKLAITKKITFYASTSKELQFLLEEKQKHNRKNIVLINNTLSLN
ncbi:hypothetical protein [Bernardetia sp.]|uniref:hypothetical protein n=1 Tax=Bernardetia sp. TaxID=1937974 RepID=UPI0025B8A5D1|nr:hypothetical protein [Bernardetia sp.]